jgi:PAS domain S-box-containing protein
MNITAISDLISDDNPKETSQHILENTTVRRSQTEKDVMKASEQNFHIMMDNALMGIRIREENDLVLYLNQAYLDIFGYKNMEEAKASDPRNQYTPESYASFLQRKKNIMQGESIANKFEIDIIRKDGALRHLQILGKKITSAGKTQYQTFYNDITEIKQAEKALKVSEQSLRSTLDNSPMGIYIVDNDLNCLYANQALLDIFGYENINEMKVNPPAKYYTPESYAGLLQRRERQSRGEPNPDIFEIDITPKGCNMRHLQVFRKDVLWDGKLQREVIYNDISDRKTAEDALRMSEEKYRLIVENSSDFIFTLNEGKFIYVSPSVKKVLGYDQGDIIGQSFRSFVHPDDLPIIDKTVKRHDEGDTQPVSGDVYRFRHSSGEWRWHTCRGTAIRADGEHVFNFVGIATDITERKQVEEKLEQAAQEWRTTFDSITDLISIHDKDNRILRVNKAIADMLHTTPQELIGKYCHEVMHGTKDPPIDCPHIQTIKSSKPSSTVTFNVDLGLHFQESTSPLFNEKGEITGSVVVIRDVTKQKRIEEQLIMTDRLASIGELSSGIAHELNNPLTSIIGFSQLLMEGDVPSDMKESLTIVYNEAQRAASIVKNLLTFGRKHAPVRELCSVNTVIEGVLRLRAYEQQVNNIIVEKLLAPDLPQIMMDHFQMQQVFLNIIVNAEFAMLETNNKGTLTISTEKTENFIRITFVDDGKGISGENLKHIFDPFFTTKEVGKGTGLGLSICHGIVTEHGGKIYAGNGDSHGAVFTVELPINTQ